MSKDPNLYMGVMEKEWQATVTKTILQLCGSESLIFHTYDSRRSPWGFPDLVAVLATSNRCIFLELKRENGVLSPAQERWINALRLAGQEAYIMRPSDMDFLVKILREGPPLRGRGNHDVQQGDG